MESDRLKTDIWMPLFVGDYLADTAHLITVEHGAYLLLLIHYWRKGPLPNDLAKIAQIAKLPPDAWSIAQGLLQEFFTLHGDGLYHQKRADREIEKWQGKRLKAREKAAAAARARWGGNAPSSASSNASSTPQAMLGSCPSPSPSPLQEKQEQMPSPIPRKRVSDAKRSPDARHSACKDEIFAYYREKNGGDDPDWEGREGKALGMFLSRNPKITAEGVRRLLSQRALSEVNHADRPALWLSVLTSYRNGPIDRFGKPLKATRSVTNGNGRGDNNLAVLERCLADDAATQNGPHADGDVPPSGDGFFDLKALLCAPGQ